MLDGVVKVAERGVEEYGMVEVKSEILTALCVFPPPPFHPTRVNNY